MALVFEGESAIKAARQVIGATNPLEAAPGSIRGDFAISVGQNMVHGSDSPESGRREAALFFPEL
jgi:nucleoside-diphosphate kinase